MCVSLLNDFSIQNIKLSSKWRRYWVDRKLLGSIVIETLIESGIFEDFSFYRSILYLNGIYFIFYGNVTRSKLCNKQWNNPSNKLRSKF